MTNFKHLLQRVLIACVCAWIIPASAASSGPRVGDKFGDWVFSCTALAKNKTVCALTQTVVTKKDNRRLVKFSVEQSEKTGSAILTAIVPLGIDIGAGVSGSIDEGNSFQYKLETCLQFGCIATHPLDGALMKAMQSGQRLNLTFTGKGSEKPFSVSGSLNGFSEGSKAANLK
jgi:invasion protein IalB